MSNADREGAVKQPFKGPFTKKQCGHHLPFWAVFDADGHGVSPDFVNPDDAQWLCDTLNRSIPTTPPAAEAGEREAFELIAVNCGEDVNRDDGVQDGSQPDPTGYVSETTQFGWTVWQASRTSLLTTPSYQDGVELTARERRDIAQAKRDMSKMMDHGGSNLGFAAIRDLLAIIDRLTPSTAGKETT